MDTNSTASRVKSSGDLHEEKKHHPWTVAHLHIFVLVLIDSIEESIETVD
jgi:hypothetical protein